MNTQREDKLNEIVARYFQSKERNESVNTDALLRDNPDLADDLKSFFLAQSQVAKAAAPLKQNFDPNSATIGAESTDLAPNVVRYFGDYELLEEIARGGMGVVYKARQVSLNRTVAIKMILAGQLASKADVVRFIAEAQAAGQLDHPNILPIYEVGEHQGQHYFSMKLMVGGSLSDQMAAAKENPKKLVLILLKVCRAVHFAHQRGVIHRDLKPANVLLDADGNPFVMDFGLAKKFEGDSALTQSGAIVGTPSYMAPEQAKGEKQLTTSVDIYSLGAILYEVLTGRPPFRGESIYKTVQQVIEKEPEHPRTLNPQASRDLCVIALKCLEKDPRRRYESARDVGDDLGNFLENRPVLARPVGRAERLWRLCRRNPAVASLTAVAILLLIAFAVSSAIGYRQISLALRETEKEKAATQEQLWNSLFAQGRAERLAGSRWASFKVLGDAAQIKTSDLLRQEAIQTIASPGVRLHAGIPFGQAGVLRLSSDGSLLAVSGVHRGVSADEGGEQQIISYRVADGQQIDRIDRCIHSDWSFVRFRPGSNLLAYQKLQNGQWGFCLRDVLIGKDMGFIPNAANPSFSPDGKYVAYAVGSQVRVASSDNLKELHAWETAFSRAFLGNDELLIEKGRLLLGWNVATNRQTFEFPIPVGHYWAGYEAVGSIIALLDLRMNGQTLTLWDVRTAKEIARLDDVANTAQGLKQISFPSLFAFDSKSRPGEIVLYDPLLKSPRKRLEGVIYAGGNFNQEQRSCLSPNGRLLACFLRPDDGTGASTIQILNIETGQKWAALRDCKNPLWTADGKFLVTVSRGTVKDANGRGSSDSSEGWVKIWEVADPAPTYQQSRSIEAISFSADGHGLAVDDVLWKVSAKSNNPTQLMRRPLPVSSDLTAYTGSGVLYAAELHRDRIKEFGNPIRFWQLEPERRDFHLTTSSQVEGISYSNEGKKVAFAPGGRHAAVLWQRFAHKDNFIIGAGQSIELWDLTQPKSIRDIYRDFYKVNFDNNGGASSTSSSEDNNKISPRRLGRNPRQLVFSSDSKKLAVAFNTGVVLYSSPQGKPERWLGLVDTSMPDTLRTIPVHCLAFSPDCKWICFGGEEGQLRIGSVAPIANEKFTGIGIGANDESWKVQQVAPEVFCDGHTGTVLAVAVSADGSILASAGEDRMIRLWEMPTGKPLAAWEAHDASISALAFKPKSQVLISGAVDGTLKLWDLAAIRQDLDELGLDWR